MKIVSELSMHLAVVSGKPQTDGQIDVSKPYVYGTAFPILPGVLLTAAHVVQAAAEDGDPAVALYGAAGMQVTGTRVDGYDLAADYDLAILYCPALERVPPIPMSFQHLGLHTPIMSTAYPFAIDAEWVNVVPRGFDGHIITRRELLHVPGQPPGYELSFPTPRGMSGAPMLAGVGPGRGPAMGGSFNKRN